MFNKFQLGTTPATFLAKNKLSSASALVLLKMMYHINRVNMIAGTPKEISTKTGITLGDFSVGIRALKKCDLIRKYTKKEYMLNPDVMFNGNDKQYFIVKHMWETQTSRGLRSE
tara:strand:+ start:44 stop:385 length:342 start_codon:yes stop_codon:yes gene_type:complete